MTDQSREEHYSLMIEWDPDDRIYVVTIPELPGCMTHGASYEEAIVEARDAIASGLDVARCRRFHSLASRLCPNIRLVLRSSLRVQIQAQQFAGFGPMTCKLVRTALEPPLTNGALGRST